MNKDELIALLETANVPLSEATPKDDEMEAETRIYFWEYTWEDIIASGQDYNTIVTYQISIISEKPRNNALMTIKKELNSKNLHPKIYHEENPETRRWHSYFSLDVLENV